MIVAWSRIQFTDACVYVARASIYWKDTVLRV